MEALTMLKKIKVDLVITDITMPEMDGIALLDWIRSNEHFHHVPVIVLTASGLEQLKQLMMDKGATAFMTQPFNSNELGKIVADCLDEN